MAFKRKSLNRTNKGKQVPKYKDPQVGKKSLKVKSQTEDCSDHTYQGNLRKQSNLKQFQRQQIKPDSQDQDDWEDYLEPQEKLDESLKDAVHYYQSLLTGNETVDESLRRKLSRQYFRNIMMDPNATIPSCPQFSRKMIANLQSQVNNKLHQNNVFMPLIFPQEGRMSKGSMKTITQNQRMLLTEFDGQPRKNIDRQRNQIGSLFPNPGESFEEAMGRANRIMQNKKSQQRQSRDKLQGEDSDKQWRFDEEKSQESDDKDYFSENSDQESISNIHTLKLSEYYACGITELQAINSDTITAEQLLLSPPNYCKANFVAFDMKKIHHYKDLDPKYYWFSGSSFVDELYMEELATNQKYLMPVLDEIRQEQWHDEFQKTFDDPDPEVVQMLFPTKKKHSSLTEQQFIYQTNESIIMSRKRMIPHNVIRLSNDLLQQLDSDLHLLQDEFN